MQIFRVFVLATPDFPPRCQEPADVAGSFSMHIHASGSYDYKCKKEGGSL